MKRVDLITRLSIITLLPLVFVHAVVAQPSDGRLEDQTKKETNIVRVDNLEVSAPNPAERDASKLIGKEASLKLKDLSGVEQSLDSLKGRIVILNFWATYCIPCRTEMPWLVALQDEFAAHGVQVIGASPVEARADRVAHVVRGSRRRCTPSATAARPVRARPRKLHRSRSRRRNPAVHPVACSPRRNRGGCWRRGQAAARPARGPMPGPSG